MKYWSTEIKAICPKTGELLTYSGDNIKAKTKEIAQKWCDENEKGYMKVTLELIEEQSFDGKIIINYTKKD